jgi:hypothetical protein
MSDEPKICKICHRPINECGDLPFRQRILKEIRQRILKEILSDIELVRLKLNSIEAEIKEWID